MISIGPWVLSQLQVGVVLGVGIAVAAGWVVLVLALSVVRAIGGKP